MRQIVLDTETTGLETTQDHRIIEIGCVEVVNRRVSRNTYHQYLQPDREIDAGAIEVHGITNEFLEDKPRFSDIAAEFVDFIKGAELVIHNAAFDVGFIDHELAKLGSEWGKVTDYCTIRDTLAMARKLHPGQKNTLDALCKRYFINNSHRELHGALLDSEILADVYLAMTGGQAALSLDAEFNSADSSDGAGVGIRRLSPGRERLRVIHASEEELSAHQLRLDAIDKSSESSCLWKKGARSEDS